MTITSVCMRPCITFDAGAEAKKTSENAPMVWPAIEPPYRGVEPMPTGDWRRSTPDDVLIIDNGSSMIRAGYSGQKTPSLAFPPDVARYRERKTNKPVAYTGFAAYGDTATRGQIKKVFEPGTSIVTNWDAMETCLDQVLVSTGVNNSLNRGVLMTEPVAGFASTRKSMNELLFECYEAPAVGYGIDALFSFRKNHGHTGLIVASGHAATHVLPVVQGKPLMSQTSRLNWGGWHCAEFLMKLLRLKYPHFPGQVKDYQVEQMVREHCYVTPDFNHDMQHFLDWTGLEERNHIIQYPFVEASVVEKSQEELDRIAEKKRQGGIRLQEQAAKMRLEKLVQKEQNLEYYKELQLRLQGQNKKEVRRLLDADEVRDENQLDRMIKDLEKRIRRARNKELEEDPEEEPEFPLLGVPDADLDESGIRQKRHQRLMKAGIDARHRAKLEKAAEAQRQAKAAERDTEIRLNDLPTWLATRREAREKLFKRIKERDRQNRDMGNRKSLASQLRMKTLANLASDGPKGKRRRGNGEDDNFGANDADWGVYRAVATGEAPSDEEDEEDLDADMQKLEQELLEFDPDFHESLTIGAARDWTKSLMHAFLRGPRPFDAESQEQQHQLHLNVERIRVPEVIFQPGIAGVDQAGLPSIAADMMDNLGNKAILKDIFLTGGNTLFNGFDDRFRQELRTRLPAEQTFALRRAQNAVLDAWAGAAEWARDGNGFKQGSVTRAQYHEFGSEYMKEHDLGNVH